MPLDIHMARTIEQTIYPSFPSRNFGRVTAAEHGQDFKIVISPASDHGGSCGLPHLPKGPNILHDGGMVGIQRPRQNYG